jgi:Ankyrin repeats (3 copies)
MHRVMLLVGMGTALLATGCSATPTTPLAAAAAGDDGDEIRRLLAAGHEPDERTEAWTPLIWAARTGALTALAALLDAGAEIDRPGRDRSHWTPLQHAIHRREPHAARLLLERGANPNASAAPGSLTPLLMAADDLDPTTVKLLLDHGADPRVGGEYGDTPLSRAVSGGALSDIDRPLFGGCRPATVRALLAHDPTLRVTHNAAGLEAIWWARFHGCEEVLRLIGEQPTKPGQTIVSGIGILRQELRETRQDGSAPTPATGDPSQR